MKLRDFPILADESVDPAVCTFFEEQGFDVLSVRAAGWQGVSDIDVIRGATADGRVVLTQDADFGRVAIQYGTLGLSGTHGAFRVPHGSQHGDPLVGVVFLRPAHATTEFTVGIVRAMLKLDPELRPPFQLIARRRGDQVSVRVRGG